MYVQIITLANPVGLSFNSFNFSSFVTPDGTPAASFWKYTRGKPGQYVRGVFEVRSKQA
jgi:hypothetical protein